MRYDFRGIQKFKANGNKFLPVGRNVLPGWMPFPCLNCNDQMYVRRNYCGIRCRLQHVLEGNAQGRATMTAVSQDPFPQQAVADRFCTWCQRLFASSCCWNHLGFHHPGEAGVSVLRLVRTDGRILTPVDDLVDFDHARLAQIQTILVDDTNMVALNWTADAMEGEAGDLCLHCLKVIEEGFSYCCLPCSLNVGVH
ncbi:hypothetical protein BS78_03G013000 [Paspalum vaginatum]|nr:hypothetical protein BS78_03G013000 [Paspalum vaginatum]